MNPLWIKWIHASINTYFTNALKVKFGIEVYIEGIHRNIDDKIQDWVEVRWNGPVAHETTKDNWFLNIELNLLISSITNRADSYAHKKVVGLVQSTIVNTFPIYQFDEASDVLFDCFQLQADTFGISTTYLGSVQQMVEIEQTSIEAVYDMFHMNT